MKTGGICKTGSYLAMPCSGRKLYSPKGYLAIHELITDMEKMGQPKRIDVDKKSTLVPRADRLTIEGTG